MKQEHFLKLAKKASQNSDHHKHKVGCVITRRNRVIGTGFNVKKTHTKSPHDYKHIHAEFMAILNAGLKVKGCTAYVFREQKNGQWAISKPCDSCQKFLIDSGIVKVVYSYEGSYKTESF